MMTLSRKVLNRGRLAFGNLRATRVARVLLLGGVIAMWVKGWLPSLVNAIVVGRERRFGLIEGVGSSPLGGHLATLITFLSGLLLLAAILLSLERLPNSKLGPSLLLIAIWLLVYLYHGANLSADSVMFPILVLAISISDVSRKEVVAVLAWLGVTSTLTALALGLFTTWGFMPELWSQGADKAVFGEHILAGAYDHSNALGQVLVLTLPLVVYHFRGMFRWLFLIAAIFAILWSASRISIAVGIGAAVVSAVVIVRTWPWMKWGVSAAALIAMTLVVAVPLLVRDPSLLTNRGFIWITAREFASENLSIMLVGSGGDIYRTVSPLTERLDYVSTTGHNLFMTTFVVGGLLAVIAMFGYLLLCIARQVSTFDDWPLGLVWIVVYLMMSIAEDPTRAFFYGPHAFIVVPMLVLLTWTGGSSVPSSGRNPAIAR